MTISQLRWLKTIERGYELCILKAVEQLVVICCYYPDICLNGTEESSCGLHVVITECSELKKKIRGSDILLRYNFHTKFRENR
jgi:hypothetical protein